MKPITAEWVAKAEADYRLARQELASGDKTQLDAVCFHAHQCAEKYLKACLQERSIRFPKTHDLTVVSDLLMPPVPSLTELRETLDKLSGLAVDVRYPGFFAAEEEARGAFSSADKVRQICRSILGLEDID